MDAQRIEDVTEWEARSFDDGYAGLRSLADRGFSGAVTDGTGWLFMLNGRVVGVVDGDLDDFADASGTAYEAPHESLPLIFAMQEQGGDVRAQYYTNDTALSEADRKLTAGNFTGYVELSENVLSGDYYVAYYGGESLAAAFVGNSRQLKTGDEAFDLADDEVGIYTVYEVDLDVREVPEPEDGGARGGSPSTEPGDEADEPSTDEADEPSTDEADEPTPPDPGDSPTVPDEESEEPAGPGPGAGATGRGATSAEEPTESEASTGGAAADEPTAESSAADGTPETRDANGEASDARDEPAATTGGRDGAPRDGSRPAESDGASDGSSVTVEQEPADDDVFSEEEQWRETKSIPALDPDESSSRTEEAAERRRRAKRKASAAREESSAREASSAREESSASAESASGPNDDGAAASTSEGGSRTEAVSERPAVKQNQLQRRVQRLESKLEETESERESLREERDDIAAERDEYREEAERLERELEEVRSELDRVKGDLREARSQLPDGEQVLSAAEALAETNLFIRYESQGGATLEKAHDGAVDRDELVDNLRIEHHTSFDAEQVVVEGQPFEEFLHDTMEYGFTEWVAESLLFEIRETGNVSDLRDLYDAIPEIDRAEIGGSVSIVRQEGGEEHREQREFDLVLRNRMGNPLFVADLNASRDPTPQATLESLVENGSAVAETSDAFAAGFAVTSSFFEPGALETAADATGGGLLSRSKRKSFVKISRKKGYHLCLAESRDGGFHLTVPEL